MTDQPTQINFTIVPDETSPAPRTYSNFCSIAHTPFDFTLTFCEVMPLSEKEIKEAEVEHVVRALRRAVVGRTIIASEIKLPKLISPLSVSSFKRRIKGLQITGVSRRGKFILIELDHKVALSHDRASDTANPRRSLADNH